MTQNQVWNNLMQLNQATLENAFTAVTLSQEQAQRMLNLSLDQAASFSREGKKIFTEWIKVGARGNETYKKAFDDGIRHLEGFLT